MALLTTGQSVYIAWSESLNGRAEESKRKVSTQPEPNLVISPDWPTKVNGDWDEDDNDDDAVADDADDADDDADARFSGCCPSQQ